MHTFPVVPESALVMPGVNIDHCSKLGEGAYLGPGAQMGAHTYTGDRLYAEAGVVIGSDVNIGDDAFFLEGARVCPDAVYDRPAGTRILGDSVIIGEGVMVPDQAALPSGTVVPNRRSIASIGQFGERFLAVTIFGSDGGPRYSIGSLVGVELIAVLWNDGGDEALSNVNDGSLVFSAEALESEGSRVQKAYDGASGLVLKLRQRRAELSQMRFKPARSATPVITAGSDERVLRFLKRD